MAAPAFVSATAHSANPTTSATVTLPTTAAGDILVLLWVNAGATATPTLTTGTFTPAWTLIDSGTWTTGAGGAHWARCTGNHSGQTVIVSGATDSVSALVIRVSGCETSGSPIGASTGASVGATNGSLSSFNTVAADALVCLTAATDDNQTKSGFTKNAVAMSNLSLAASSGGGDSGVGFAASAQASIGATGNFAITEAAGTAQGKRLSGFALKAISLAPVDGPVLDLKWDTPTEVDGSALDLLWDAPTEVDGGVLDLVWDVIAAAIAKKGTFAAQVAGGSQAVTGVGFAPRAVILWGALLTSGDGPGASVFLGFAGKDEGGTITNRCFTGATEDASASTDTNAIVGGSTVVQWSGVSADTIDCAASLTSFDADGFTLNWSNAPASAWVIHYLALDVDEAYAGDFQPTATGAKTISGVGFEPTLTLFGSVGLGMDANASGCALHIGAASDGIQERTTGIAVRNAIGTSEIATHFDDDACVGIGTTGATGAAVDALADFGVFNGDGFTLNVSNSAARSSIYLALKRAGHFAVGTLTQPTSAGTEVVTGLGFEPVAVLVAGAGATSAAVVGESGKFAIGAGDGTAEGGIATEIVDNEASGNAQSRTSTTKILSYIDQAGTTLAEADLQSLDADGFTLDWTTADAVARKGFYIAFPKAGSPVPVNGPALDLVWDTFAQADRPVNTYSEYLLSLGPSLYFPFDAARGITDQSGNGRNGTGVGSPSIGGETTTYPPIANEPQSCTDLDGSTQAITTTYDPFVGGTAFSACGWAYRDTSTTSDTLFGGDTGAATQPWLRLPLSTNDTRWRYVSNVNGSESNFVGSWPGNGVWIFWAIVADDPNDRVSLYINGALVATQTNASTYGAGNLKIGAHSSGLSDPWDGKFGHLAAFSGTVLTRLQVEYLWEYASGVSGPVRLKWDVEAGAATPVDGPVLDLVSDLRSEVSAAVLDLVADLRSEVSGGVLDLKWDARSEVSGSVLDLVADLRAEVSGGVLDLKWDARTTVDGNVLDLVADLRADVAGGVLDVVWDLRTGIDGGVLDLEWDAVAEVSGTALDLVWDARAEATGNVLDLVWDLQTVGAVNGAPLDLLWDLSAEATSGVLDLVWDLRSAANAAALDFLWDLRVGIDGAITDLLWDLRSAADGPVLDLVWDLAAPAGTVEGLVLDLLWDLRSEVDQALGFIWDLRVEAASGALELLWDVRNSLDGSALDVVWDVRNEAEAEALELLWDLPAEVAKALVLKWDLERELLDRWPGSSDEDWLAENDLRWPDESDNQWASDGDDRWPHTDEARW